MARPILGDGVTVPKNIIEIIVDRIQRPLCLSVTRLLAPLISGRGKRFFSSSWHAHRLWGPPSLLSRGVKLTIPLYAFMA
jgi:hypothetical protein